MIAGVRYLKCVCALLIREAFLWSDGVHCLGYTSDDVHYLNVSFLE